MATYNPYDFQRFVDSVKDLDYENIVTAASGRRYQMQSISFSHKGAKQAREMGSAHFMSQLSGLISWLRDFQKPLGLSDGDFASLRVLCENLVKKGQLKPEALDAFDSKKT